MTQSLKLTPLAGIDGQDINIATMDDAVTHSIARLKGGDGFTFCTFNLDHVVKRRADAAFRAAYDRATFVSADGAPIVWLARRRGARIARVTGADLVAPLCAAAERERLPIAFYGSSTRTLATAAARLRQDYPRLRINFLEAPPNGFDPTSAMAEDAADRIARSGARVCFVALGAPKQELFAEQAFTRHPNIGFIGVGAALDFIAGDQIRAPEMFQRLGVEWTWRLLTNPRRLAPRYARCAAALADLMVRDAARPAVNT